MRRRGFLCGLATGIVLPGLIAAQERRLPRIGILVARNPAPFLRYFLEGLRGVGYVEGQTIDLVLKSAEGQLELLPGLAAELVQTGVAVIVAHQTPTVLAAMKATQQIPIIMAPAGDPLALGIVTNLSRPSGNVTGVHSATAESVRKTLQIAQLMLPSASRVAALLNVTDPFFAPFLAHIQAATDALKLELRQVHVEGDRDLERGFAEFTKERVEAVIVQPSLSRQRAAELALLHRIPAISPNREFPEAGCLMSYAASLADQYSKPAVYVQKILSGSKPADLPVEQPTRFELVINTKTATALGLNIPDAVLAIADELLD